MKTLLLTFLLASCALVKPSSSGTYYEVDVDSISAPKAYPKTFTIVSGDSSISNSDLRFKKFAEMTKRALVDSGFIYEEKKPEIKILLTYGIGEPITTITSSSAPVYGNTQSNITGAWGQNLGNVQTFGQTETETETEQITHFKRTIVLKAVEVKSNEPAWETVLTSSGGNSDLMRAAPYLLYAATGEFGTTNKVTYKVYKNNPKVPKY